MSGWLVAGERMRIDGQVVKKTEYGARCAYAAPAVSSGKHKWTVQANFDSFVWVGVTSNTSNADDFPYRRRNTECYMYASVNGFSYHKREITHDKHFKRYSGGYDDSDTIDVVLDLDSGTIAFGKNGVSQGVAYNNVKKDEEYWLTVFTFSAASFKLLSYSCLTSTETEREEGLQTQYEERIAQLECEVLALKQENERLKIKCGETTQQNETNDSDLEFRDGNHFFNALADDIIAGIENGSRPSEDSSFVQDYFGMHTTK